LLVAPGSQSRITSVLPASDQQQYKLRPRDLSLSIGATDPRSDVTPPEIFNLEILLGSP